MTESLEETLAKIKMGAPSTTDFLIKEPTIKEEPIGMNKRIEDSRRFNESLKNEELLKDSVSAAIDVRPSRLEELRSILKRYGMDSQQQEYAFKEIKALFGE